MEPPNPSSSLRVLIRPSSSTTKPPTTTAPNPSSTPLTKPTTTASTNSSDLPHSTNPSSSSSSSSSSQTCSPDGVVVVGFIGRGEEESVSQLMNRILDDNVFGSGNLDKGFPSSALLGVGGEVEVDDEAVKKWFRSRRISYYYEEEKGIVFLQFVDARSSGTEGLEKETELGLDLMLEEQEFGDLQGMLYMFSVCHVLIFLQEGSRFDTQILKKFRMLQAAKHALAPFIKSHVKPTLNSGSSSSTQPTVPLTSSKNSSPGRGVSVTSRHASSISLMSGLNSYPSLFPGQCTPVILFVFLDDFSEAPNPNAGSHIENSAEAPPLKHSSSISNLARSSLPVKGSSSVVVLARPANKSEGGLKKKLQSSLEAQIRFLIKKFRTLSGSESSNAGPRGGGNASLAPLFSLDASRTVALLDRSNNQKGESLDFATSLVEDILNSKGTSDVLLLESHGQNVNKEDIQSIIEFIFRQSDILRGRGGMLANASSGSATGVGMVAVAAAAAAAASAASGKPMTTPELPSLGNWLSCSQIILDALLSAKGGCLDKNKIVKRKPVRQNSATTEKVPTGGIDPVEAALSWLESGNGLNMKFSTAWCQSALPAAKEVYLKDLPACYPTSLHEAQLGKALQAFNSMVKGPAVKLFRQKLEDECTSIWKSGRQLCDAVSLTGKPCMHQRHNVEVGGPLLGAEVKPHSSGFVFLHACACGRSRRIRDDPFDFTSANITFNHFPNCDNLLPALELPQLRYTEPIQPSSWSLIRVGSASYYQPSKGLLQGGFCSTEKYLLKWSIILEKQAKSNEASQKVSAIMSNQKCKVEPVSNKEMKKSSADQLFQGEAQTIGVENQIKITNKDSPDDQKISFGRGLPHFNMRRPFAEVVAGSIATDAAFPPLQQKKLSEAGVEKVVMQKVAKDVSDEPGHKSGDCGVLQKPKDVSSAEESSCNTGASGHVNGNPFLHIGSNLVPVNMSAGGKIKSNTSVKHSIVYVGFEHECSHGHRFLLNSEHLNELGSPYSVPEESHINPSVESSGRKATNSLRSDKNSADDKVQQLLTVAANPVRASNEPKQTVVIGNQHRDGSSLSSGSEIEPNKYSSGLPSIPKSVKELGESLQYATLDDGGAAFSLLNRNIPIYMSCPHCRVSKAKVDRQKVKFASTISQLQRIFLVTPHFPVVLATCPVVQFEASCLPPSVMDCEVQSKFSIGCRVILPPDSFVTLRLPFVYGVQLEDRSLQPLKPLEHLPERTAWVMKSTVLQVLSKGSSLGEEFHTSLKN